MNSAFTQKQYNGFRLNESLASRIRFSGVLRFREIQMRKSILSEEKEQIYWILIDENGARLSCWKEDVVQAIKFYTSYEVRGQVRITKGGTFLNLEEAKEFCPSEYTENR